MEILGTVVTKNGQSLSEDSVDYVVYSLQKPVGKPYVKLDNEFNRTSLKWLKSIHEYLEIFATRFSKESEAES